ncbi:MAG TPA: GntR family transcriptional regulator [Tepidisphaeraceae bacterium]|jgi:DNA-binding transcriptional regulator YhcF (GntR family)|nr:GntR family transcriptional regulator [Tepidisphaeraceae bacterium]
MDHQDVPTDDPQDHGQDSRLSYKFQRLRERLRQAIASGELSGKLPGERQLSRRFRVNAKTLSKALTDLAAEGLLERSIGRGTFVRGHQTPQQPAEEKWLLVCDQDQIHAPVVQAICQANPAAQIATDITSMRPSFINQFKAVVDFASKTPDHFLRDLIVRNITLVAVGREPRTYSSHAVLVDRVLGASQLARQMMLSGHTRFFVIERAGQTLIAEAVRRAAARYAPAATIDTGEPKDVPAAIQHGVTAFICGTRPYAAQAREQLERLGAEIPEGVSLGAVGTGWGEYPCSGYFVHAAQKAESILHLLRDKNAHRPVVMWLSGEFIDGHTIGAQSDDVAMPHVPHMPRITASA